MNKTDLLLQMMEQPQHYTAEEWQEILADEECRELYTLMSKTQSAFDMQQEVSDEEIDAEWQRLEKRHSSFSKVAAVFIGILMISGIAYAAIHISHHYSHDAEDQQPVVTVEKKKPAALEPVAKDSTVVTQPIVFDNVSLDKIARTIADYHHKEAEVKNDQAAELRFYFVWNQTDSLQTVVEQLNQFERVDIVVENDKLIVR